MLALTGDSFDTRAETDLYFTKSQAVGLVRSYLWREEVRGMVNDGSILVTGAAGQLGSVGRTVTGLLLDRGFAVRAMVRREDKRAAALRAVESGIVFGLSCRRSRMRSSPRPASASASCQSPSR